MEDMSTVYFPISSAVVLRARGRDSKRYLNARLSNDIRSLASGSTCRAGMLTAQGKTEGLFHVIAIEEADFLLVSDSGDATALRSALARFIVADRVEISDVSDTFSLIHIAPRGDLSLLHNVGTLQNSRTTLPDMFAYQRNRGFREGVDVICSQAGKDRIFKALLECQANAVPELEREIARIRAGEPDTALELSPDTLFQEAGLRDSISFKKGCYVGQEVVEKVDAIGKLGRRIFRLRIKGKVDFGSRKDNSVLLAADKSPIGRILSSAYDSGEDATFAFASLKNNDALFAGVQVEVAGHEGEIQ